MGAWKYWLVALRVEHGERATGRGQVEPNGSEDVLLGGGSH